MTLSSARTASLSRRVFESVSRPRLSAPVLILLAVAWIALVDNAALWREIALRLDLTSLAGGGYAATLLALMVLLLVLPLLLLPRVALRPALLCLLLLCGTLAYFIGELGVVFDVDMIRNLVETVRDRNVQEGAELVSGALGVSLALTVALPAWLVLRTRLVARAFRAEAARRVLWGLGLTAVTLALVMLDFRSVAYVSRENHDLEAWLNPHYPIIKAQAYVTRTLAARDHVFTELGADATRTPRPGHRTVGVMVVGETARSDHLALNGYARETTPELAARDIVDFPDATSCGTSTAYSVPCMFSFLDADAYTPEKADAQSNALDVIARSGVEVLWMDNNSSCKGVCTRVPTVNLTQEPDPASPLYVEGAWLDEVLLGRLDDALDASDARARERGEAPPDVLVVLHLMGSHGPAYYRRYPDAFAHFTPACRSKAPQDCPAEETVNAYDNTILYTDHVLAALVDRLDARADEAFLLYASDHGESLGENGVFLHGLPTLVAPAAQRHVPMLAWFSDAFAEAQALGFVPDGVRRDTRAVSHDNLSATLLGLYDVRTTRYEPSLDLFAAVGAADVAPSSTLDVSLVGESR